MACSTHLASPPRSPGLAVRAFTGLGVLVVSLSTLGCTKAQSPITGSTVSSHAGGFSFLSSGLWARSLLGARDTDKEKAGASGASTSAETFGASQGSADAVAARAPARLPTLSVAELRTCYLPTLTNTSLVYAAPGKPVGIVLTASENSGREKEVPEAGADGATTYILLPGGTYVVHLPEKAQSRLHISFEQETPRLEVEFLRHGKAALVAIDGQAWSPQERNQFFAEPATVLKAEAVELPDSTREFFSRRLARLMSANSTSIREQVIKAMGPAAALGGGKESALALSRIYQATGTPETAAITQLARGRLSAEVETRIARMALGARSLDVRADVGALITAANSCPRILGPSALAFGTSLSEALATRQAIKATPASALRPGSAGNAVSLR